METRVRRSAEAPEAEPALSDATRVRGVSAAVAQVVEIDGPWVPPPMRDPPPARRRLPLGLLVVALVVVAAAGFAAGWLSHSPAAATPPVNHPAPFVVTGVSAQVAPGKLSCPAAVAHLSGTIRADHGGGVVTYDWSLPGGATTSPATLTLAADQSSGVATLAYTLSGSGSLTGAATLHVLSPLSAYSAPVPLHYTCSSKRR